MRYHVRLRRAPRSMKIGGVPHSHPVLVCSQGLASFPLSHAIERKWAIPMAGEDVKMGILKAVRRFRHGRRRLLSQREVLNSSRSTPQDECPEE